MLSIQNDFSNFDRVDWSTTYKVSIRFLIELLAHTYGKNPEQIIESLRLCNEDLPTLRYEEKESDNFNDPQWMLLRYRTVLHTRVLLSNMLESSSWGRVPNSSISCREEIEYKGATYPDASVIETIFEAEDENSGVSKITRIVTPKEKVPFADYWAYRQEIEEYLIKVPAFSGWYALLPELVATRDESAAQLGKTIDPDTHPTWVLRPISGGQWECGNESALKKLKKLEGFSDIVYAIKWVDKEFSALSLPGVGAIFSEEMLGEDEEFSNIAEFGSDDMSDDKATPQYAKKIRELDGAIEEARATGALYKVSEKLDDLAFLRRHLKESTRPGNKRKKLDTGNPAKKEANNARNRKNTVVTKLKDAGLPVMAKHLEDYYLTKDNTIIYTNGPPYPIWDLEKH